MPDRPKTEINTEVKLLVDWITRVEKKIDGRLEHQEKQNDRIIDKVAEVMGEVNSIKIRLATGDEVIKSLKEKDAAQDRHFESTDASIEKLKEDSASRKGHYIASALALASSVGAALIAWLTGKTPLPPPGSH